MTYSITILIILTILQVADIITTYKALQLPGRYEKNRFMAKIQDKLGVTQGVIMPKFGAMFISDWLLLTIPHPLMWGVMSAMCLAYVYLIYNNYRQL